MITGKKVVFRAIEEKDVKHLQKWHNDSVLSELVVGWTFPVSMQEEHEWYLNSLKNKTVKRFIIENKNKSIIGLTGLWEIDWKNRNALTAVKIGEKTNRGRGYGFDAIMTMMSYAFYDIGLNRVWSTIIEYNVASYNAYVRKCGWKVEGRLRKHIFRKGKFHDLLYVSALKEDFEKWAQAKEYIPSAFLGKNKQCVRINDSEKIIF